MFTIMNLSNKLINLPYRRKTNGWQHKCDVISITHHQVYSMSIFLNKFAIMEKMNKLWNLTLYGASLSLSL